MSIKVANIILDGRFGGPQNRILQVAERLKKYGIETTVIIPKKDSEIFYSKLVEKNIHVKKLSLHHLTKHKPHLVAKIIFFLPELFFLYRYLKREKFRLVHTNTSWQIKGVLAAKFAGAKIVMHLNDMWKSKFIRLIFNLLAPLCDGFIVTGSRVKELYLKGNKILNGKNIIEIQAPVDTTIFNPENVHADNLIKNKRGLKIITVGNINPTKGLEYFIEMAEILNRQYDNLAFYIVGACFESQKIYFNKLIKLIKNLHINNVFYYGNSNNVNSCLKASDIFVCTSLNESGPMSVWEAMAMEKAIISFDVGHVSEYIKDGYNGFIVPQKDPLSLAEKVSVLIEDENLRIKFGKRAREIAVKELDIEICAEKHRQFYLEVLGEQATN